MKKIQYALVPSIVLALSIVFAPFVASASTTVGTIDPVNRYAWGENVGWIDFGSTAGNVTVTDSGLTGYAYGENVGWILLTSVTNDGNGNLAGYAWGENVGWVDFSHVTISSSGVFSGYAYGENIGNIIFGATNDLVTTDWRPASVRNAGGGGTGGGTGGGASYSSSGGGSTASPAQLAQILAPSASTTAYLESLTNSATTPSSACPVGWTCTPIAQTTPPSTAPASPSPSVTFTTNLTQGTHSSSVQSLQVYLNSHGFTIANTGAGSPGHETTYFGLLTKQALAKFQAAHGIVPAVGYFGPITRAYISSH